MAEADISTDLQNTSAALSTFQTSLNSLASSMTTQTAVADRAAKAESKRFKDISKGLGNAAKKMGDVGKKLGIIAGISFSMKGVLDILLKVDRSMQKFNKQLGTTAGQTERLFKLTTKVEKDFNKMGMSLDDAMHASAALAQEFGSAAKVSEGMIKTVGQLNKAFGISVGEAAAFTERMTETGKNIENFTKVLAKDALKAGVNLGVVFRDVVKNVGMMELYSNRTAEQLADMVTSAAQLGVSVGTFEKAAGAWEDFEKMSDNIGRAANAFGVGFENALPSMIDLRTMWSEMQDPELVELTTKAFAGQLELIKKGDREVLVMAGTKKELDRDRLNIMRDMYNGELEFGKRDIKRQIRYEKFLKVRKTFDESRWDMTKKEFTALNDIVKTQEHGKHLYELEGTAREKALKAADEIIAKRELESKQSEALMKVIEDGMGFLEKMQAALTAFIQPYLTTISTLFSDEFLNAHVMPFFTTIQNKLGEVFSQEGDGAFNFTKIFEDLKAGNFMTVVGDLASSVGGLIKEGVVWAFDLSEADADQGWDTIVSQLIEKLTTALNTAIPAMQKFVDDVLKPLWETALEFLDKSVFPAITKFLKESETTVTGWMNTAHAYLVKEAPKWGETMGIIFAKGLAMAWDIVWPMMRGAMVGVIKSIPGYETAASIAGGLSDAADSISGWFDREGYDTSGTTVGMGGQWGHRGDKGGVPTYGNVLGGNALGYTGGRHRGIVGEAGTEVGITRSALRELSSAGIPGYQLGLGDRQYQYASRGSVGSRGRAAADNQAVGGAYRDRLGRFLESQRARDTKFLEGQHDIWARDAKQFFVDYPAAVDKAFGEAFRAEGGMTEALYNSVFSGMQAYSRAELSGASPAQAKRAMEQHMAAEGMKPGGAINRAVDRVREWQEKIVVENKKILDVNRAGNALLGGVAQGLQMAGGIMAAGGSRDQAKEAAKRGLIGGTVADLTAQFGTADKGFLSSMNTMGMLLGTVPMPSGSGRDAGQMLSEAMRRTESTFQSQGYGVGWGGGNAQGRVYNSPHLAMVGEGSQNEIIVPTERIRKGLPINAGVARELGSIGVPGYQEGGGFWSSFRSGRGAAQYQAANPGQMVGHKGFGVGGRLGHSYESMGGAGGGLATAGLQFAQSYQQTGDLGASAGMALGAGIGFGATMAISAIPGVGPFIGPILGPMIGSFIGGKLAGMLGKKPHYKRYRNRAIKSLEEHVLTEGMFTFGQPAGIKKNIERAMSGKDKKMPSEEAFEKLMSGVGGSKVLSYGFSRGITPEQLMGLLGGQVKNTGQANQIYRAANQAFYGTPMAKGGIVTGPTRAIIGEKGPEAVIPLGQHGGYASRQQQDDQKNIIGELRKQNQQMGMFIKNMGDAKTVLQVDGRQLAETVGSNMYDINTGM